MNYQATTTRVTIKQPEGSTKRIEIDGAYVTKDAEQQEQLHEARFKPADC